MVNTWACLQILTLEHSHRSYGLDRLHGLYRSRRISNEHGCDGSYWLDGCDGPYWTHGTYWHNRPYGAHGAHRRSRLCIEYGRHRPDRHHRTGGNGYEYGCHWQNRRNGFYWLDWRNGSYGCARYCRW